MPILLSLSVISGYIPLHVMDEEIFGQYSYCDKYS